MHRRCTLVAGRHAEDAAGVAHDVFKAHIGEVVQGLLRAFFRQRIHVAGLRGGHDERVVALMVLDEGLVQVGLALDDADVVLHLRLSCRDAGLGCSCASNRSIRGSQAEASG